MQRNRNYQDTHRILIKKAFDIMSASGVDSLSLSALARVTGINRSTVYYHFADREDLLLAVHNWSTEEMDKQFQPGDSQWGGVDRIPSFVLRNPEVVKLWIDDYLAAGDIRQCYPQWDRLVEQMGQAFAEQAPDEPRDVEVFCTLMLTSAFIAPRVFKNAVQPQESLERIADRFVQEQQRMLQPKLGRAT